MIFLKLANNNKQIRRDNVLLRIRIIFIFNVYMCAWKMQPSLNHIHQIKYLIILELHTNSVVS